MSTLDTQNPINIKSAVRIKSLIEYILILIEKVC